MISNRNPKRETKQYIVEITKNRYFGKAGLANLQPGQQSAFTITTNIPSGDEVTRYGVLPGGSAG